MPKDWLGPLSLYLQYIIRLSHWRIGWWPGDTLSSFFVLRLLDFPVTAGSYARASEPRETFHRGILLQDQFGFQLNFCSCPSLRGGVRSRECPSNSCLIRRRRRHHQARSRTPSGLSRPTASVGPRPPASPCSTCARPPSSTCPRRRRRLPRCRRASQTRT